MPSAEMARARAARLAAIPRRDRIAPLAAEGAARDFRPRRRLLPLPFAGADQVQHALYGLALEACRDDLLARLLLVDMAQQDRVQHLIRRQGILVRLVLAQLGRRRP